jgi:hypothetical protein
MSVTLARSGQLICPHRGHRVKEDGRKSLKVDFGVKRFSLPPSSLAHSALALLSLSAAVVGVVKQTSSGAQRTQFGIDARYTRWPAALARIFGGGTGELGYCARQLR